MHSNSNTKQKLKHLVLGTALSGSLALGAINQANIKPVDPDLTTIKTELSRVTEQEIEMLAKLLYGEAGRGADRFEVAHTVFNRMSSPLFKNSMADVITQKNQYIGYRETNPVTQDNLDIARMAAQDWEKNGCHGIDGCNHFYFVTAINGICNRHEISEDPQGRWVPYAKKKYSRLMDYCPTAREQNTRFNREHGRLF